MAGKPPTSHVPRRRGRQTTHIAPPAATPPLSTATPHSPGDTATRRGAPPARATPRAKPRVPLAYAMLAKIEAKAMITPMTDSPPSSPDVTTRPLSCAFSAASWRSASLRPAFLRALTCS